METRKEIAPHSEGTGQVPGMSISVQDGGLTVLRLFDVANAIDLGRVEQLAAAPARIRLQHAAAKAISFEVPPVEFSLGKAAFPLGDTSRETDVLARIYDFGAVSILIRFTLSGMTWLEYVESVNRLAAAADSEAGHEFWRQQLDHLRRVVGPALERPNPDPIEEDYLIASVHQVQPALDGATFLNRIDLAPLLSGETRPLSASARAELVRHALSYYQDDLVVVTWDRAFVLDTRSGTSDIADVLEVANAQLLELRYYDDQLDDELPRMYERVAGAQRGLRGLGRRRYAALARELHRRVAEVTEITERVDNALKVTEDVYLARVYNAALDLLRMKTWADAVDHKLSIMRDTYTTLYDEAATARAELLEITIVLLILFEIVWAFIR
jgi:hypothetical protein